MLTKLYQNIPSKHQISFLAYNILYDAIMNNTIDMHHHLVVAHKHLAERPIQHSLLVVKAIRTVDYIYYLKLMKTAPKYSRFLMEIHLPAGTPPGQWNHCNRSDRFKSKSTCHPTHVLLACFLTNKSKYSTRLVPANRSVCHSRFFGMDLPLDL